MLPSVVCASRAAELLAGPDVVAAVHQHGCLHVGDDLVHTEHVLAGLGANPNVAACVVLSLGCETLRGARLAELVAAAGTPVELLTIQELGGTAATVAAGRAAVARLRAAHQVGRSPVEPEAICVGLDAVDGPRAAAVEDALRVRGFGAVRAPHATGAAAHADLAAAGAQVVVSLVAPDDAPVGALIVPVIATGTDSELHVALADDFDLLPGGRTPEALAEAVADAVEATFDGAPTAAETRGSAELVLRRLAMTM